MSIIEALSALEILDSRGRPTVQCTCALAGGATASASVPSGASTGAAEAIELRDGDQSRYRGLGCRKAAGHVSTQIAAALCGRRFEDQRSLDAALCDLDGTPNKSRLGANAILAVSIAFARACAVERGVPLYEQFADIAGRAGQPLQLPRLTVNLFSGGKHAGGQVAIQDVLIVPTGAGSIDESLSMCWAVYQSAAEIGLRRYQSRPLSADEGGLAPPFEAIEPMFDAAVESIEAAGLRPGRDMHLAVDVASTHFHHAGRYQIGDESLDAAGMIDRIAGWVDRYPIVSVEDGLAEDDWENWPALRAKLADRCLTLGDDLLCTNPRRIERAVASNAADALLLKVNQVGTLTEAAEALKLARAAGWRVTVSARSGETEDHWLADLSVGFAGDQIKVGSVTQSERLSKYNRLLAIEADTGVPLVAWPRR